TSDSFSETCMMMGTRYRFPIIMHVSENESEVEQIRGRYGLRPVAHLDRMGLLGPDFVALHCVALDDQDMDLLAQNKVHVVHNPESNMKLASGIAPVPRLLDRGVNVALGTDGCASNNDLDLFAEMDTCAKLHKVSRMDPTVLPARSVLGMAVGSGARALGFGADLGEISTGKLADIIVLDFNRPHLTPLYDTTSHLVYAARGADVRHSIIHGRLVMEDRQVLTLDVDEVMDHVRNLARAVRTTPG
ncbi:MAG TPA: amidohydrolase family protein, partial [Syntrophobacteraceae bacterium]|nr:amidohydrolase family protein [Syntrophobacteraceae bacterium]